MVNCDECAKYQALILELEEAQNRVSELQLELLEAEVRAELD